MRPRKPTRLVNGITIPNPPKYATHVEVFVEGGKKAIVGIKDFETLLGTEGVFRYIKKNNSGKILEKWENMWKWSGEEVIWDTAKKTS